MSTLHLLTHLEFPSFLRMQIPGPALFPPGYQESHVWANLLASLPRPPNLLRGSFPPPFAFALALAGISGNTGTRGIGREAVGTLGLVLPGAGEYYWLVIGLGL